MSYLMSVILASASCPTLDVINPNNAALEKLSIEQTAFIGAQTKTLTDFSFFEGTDHTGASSLYIQAIEENLERSGGSETVLTCLLRLELQSQYVLSLPNEMIAAQSSDFSEQFEAYSIIRDAIFERNRNWLVANLNFIDWNSDIITNLASHASVYHIVYH